MGWNVYIVAKFLMTSNILVEKIDYIALALLRKNSCKAFADISKMWHNVYDWIKGSQGIINGLQFP